MWYYELNNQPFGPVSKEIIAEDVRTGKINADTLVWREGWTKWVPLGDTEFAELVGLPVAEKISQPMTPPTIINVPQQKKIDPNALARLFWWWFGLNLTVFPFLLITLFSSGQSWVLGLLCVFEIPLVAGGILQFILVYKLWQMIQDGFARTTPGKAVGFLFIPFFSLYWLFVAYYGLVRDQVGYIKRHFSDIQVEQIRKPHPVLALCYLIFAWAYILFYIILMIVAAGRMFTSVSDPTAFTNVLQPYNLVITIFSFIQMTLMFLMFFDFFMTAKSILVTEGRQA